MKLFSLMAGKASALPFLLLLPTAFFIFIILGLGQEDRVETQVYNIWSSRSSDYYKDSQYEDGLDMADGATSLLAVGRVRKDDGNIANEESLEEVRARMEAVESVTVDYKGNTFTWQDICGRNNAGLGTAYQFPCVRITPMDFFQEANWFMTEADRLTWYDLIQSNVVAPRISRFGIMQEYCSSQGTAPNATNKCDLLLGLRFNADFAEANGYPRSYASPLKLFSDLTAMGMDDPCRVCIESTYDVVLDQFTEGVKGMFGVMALELERSLEDTFTLKKGEVLGKVASIVQKIDRTSVEDYFSHYVTRGLYGKLGQTSYIAGYNTVKELIGLLPDLPTDADTLTSVVGAALIQHADAPFSSDNTLGNPLPLFGGGPVGGSGLDLTGVALSSFEYFDTTNYAAALIGEWNPDYVGGAAGFANPEDASYIAKVESDPVYKWFMAGETPMTSHCGNDVNPPLVTGQGCTKYNTPFETDGEETVLHFAKMWYQILIDSDGFLGIKQGSSDPYTWTNGEGCGYDLKGSRANYTEQDEETILKAMEGNLYYIDEGSSIGALDKNFLIGGENPAFSDVSADNPLTDATTFMTIYPALPSSAIPDRVKNCNRPGEPITDFTEDDAKEVLGQFKIKMTEAWSKGWNDDDDGTVQFTAFFDDGGDARGTFGNTLKEITLDNGRLTGISIALIAATSVIFLASCDLVNSMVLITLIGVGLVILSFFGSLGFGVLVGIKINLIMAWTLPFVIIGLGVDDMYIVLLALKKRKGDTKQDFIDVMKEVIVPVSMTSFVNASMFALMNIVDIGAIYKTAQSALICVIFLYLAIIFCFPAFCYLDILRQKAKRYDVIPFLKAGDGERAESGDGWGGILYRSYFRPIVLGNIILKLIVLLLGAALVAVGIYGITEREVGLGLEDFFANDHQASAWSKIRTEEVATWPVSVAWGAIDYKDPEEQLAMMKQFEDIINTDYIAASDTSKLWISKFNYWTTRHCEEVHFGRDDLAVKECGRDQVFEGDADDTGTSCSGTWMKNTLGLREMAFEDTKSGQCSAFVGGICRPGSKLHPGDILELGIDVSSDDTYCPVFKDWSDEKFAFCLQQWNKFTGGGGSLITKEDTATPYESCDGEYYSDAEVVVPIPISKSPTLYAKDLTTHEDSLELIRGTRQVCDEDDSLHCWMNGIPYDYWEQYLTVEKVLLTVSGVAVGAGLIIAFLFLFIQTRAFAASAVGAILIAGTSLMCLIPVVGISILLGVSLTAFSNMSFVLSIGFAVEYSVHIVQRFISAPKSITDAHNRVAYTMEFLALPLTLSFLSSTIGICCLAFTSFEFNRRFFFQPLMVVMLATFFVGCWLLPVILTFLNFEFMRVGGRRENEDVMEKAKGSSHDLEA